MNDGYEKEWIRASKAYTEILKVQQSPTLVQNDIALFLRDGRLKARAKRYWITKPDTTVRMWKSAPETVTPKDISLGVWRMEYNIAEDRNRWRIAISDILVTRSDGRVIMMSGVSFLLADIRKIYPNIFGKGARLVSPLKRRRTARSDGRHSSANLVNLTADWIAKAREHKLSDVFGALQADRRRTDFADEIIRRCEELNIDPAPSPATCYRHVAELFKLNDGKQSKLSNETNETTKIAERT